MTESKYGKYVIAAPRYPPLAYHPFQNVKGGSPFPMEDLAAKVREALDKD